MVDAIGSKKLEDAIDEEQTPSPMNTMLNKQSREEAIQKRNTRDRMQLLDVAPTNPGILKLVIIQLDLKSVNNAMTVDHPKFVTFYLVPTAAVGSQGNHPPKPRSASKCKMCKQPMKGNKNVVNCPQNKKV
jgi:hypothetical protein